jgi:hypothetical protein
MGGASQNVYEKGKIKHTKLELDRKLGTMTD